MGNIRLDRYLADVHVGSRKQIREFIRDGRVRVNGEVVVKTEHHVDTRNDAVSFDGRVLVYFKHRYILLNKPAGVVSATKDGLSKTVIDLLSGVPVRKLSPIGRLDKDTEGLLLITDDGEMAHALLSPARMVGKSYEVHLEKPATDEMLDKLRLGVDIGDDTFTRPAEAKRLEPDEEGREVILLTIHEGRFHQVKRMMHAVGNECVFLKRVQFGTLTLEDGLKTGMFRNLSGPEINSLKALYKKQDTGTHETDA